MNMKTQNGTKTQTGVAMNVDQIIERLCLLQEEVANRHVGYDEGSDCFCGKGGFWKRERYGGTFEQGYRNTGKALEFIEAAVREKLDSTCRETKTGATIYLLCEDCEDSWADFEVLGWSHDKDLLTAECTRLENEKYQKERKIWDENGGEPNFGPIAPDDRQNGYRQYYVKAVGQWPTPNNDLAKANETTGRK